jgi:hypothetical protein
MRETLSVFLKWLRARFARVVTLSLVLAGTAQPVSTREPGPLTVVDRVERIRAVLSEREQTPHVAGQPGDSNRAAFSQWRNWSNWRGWANWNNWSNWGNWRNR